MKGACQKIYNERFATFVSFFLLDPEALGRLSTELAEQWYAWSLMFPPWMSIVVLPKMAPPLVAPLYLIREGVSEFFASADRSWDFPFEELSFDRTFSLAGLFMSGD